MFRNGNGFRGQGRGAGGGWGRGAGFGRGRGFFGPNQAENWESGVGWNQPLSALSAGIPESEKKSWLERFKSHLTHRMSEVDEELNNY